MRDRLRQDLAAALKARDRAATAALRSTIAAIENAEAVDPGHAGTLPASSSHIAGASAGVGSSDVPRRELTAADLQAIVRREIDDRRRAAREYTELGRTEAADRLSAEADVLARYIEPR